MPDNKIARSLNAGIQIKGGNQSFERIGQQRLFFSSAAHLLAPPQQQVMSQLKARRYLVKMRRAHQVSLHFGQPAFRIIGMPRHQGLACQEAENRIAQKFELLVVGGRLGILLVHARLVRKGPFQ